MPPPVPLPRTRFIRPFTTHILNPFIRLFVHRLPGFAIISHRGRKSGETHRTPMNIFRDGDDYLFALTYGSDVQWVKNVLAAGEADLRIGETTVHLTDPELFVDPKRRLMPLPVRFVLGLMRVSESCACGPATSSRSPCLPDGNVRAARRTCRTRIKRMGGKANPTVVKSDPPRTHPRLRALDPLVRPSRAA